MSDGLPQRCLGWVKAVGRRALASAHRPDSLDQAQHLEGGEPLGATVGWEDPGYRHVELATHVDRMLARLTEREERILWLRFEQDMLQREIAERCGLSRMHV